MPDMPPMRRFGAYPRAMKRRARLLLLPIVAVLVAMATAGTATGPASAAPKGPTLIVRDLPAQVRLAPGESVQIVLSTNVTTGYSWHAEGGCCAKGTDLAVARVSKGRYTAPEAMGMVGVPGTTTWTVTALRTGKTAITIVTRPPGADNTMQDEEVGTLTVIVQRP